MKFLISLILLSGFSVYPNHAMDNPLPLQPSTVLTKQLKNHDLLLKLAHPPSLDACRFVAENLLQINQEKMGQYAKIPLKLPLSDKPLGEIYQHSLEIMNIKILEKILRGINSKAAHQKAHDLVSALLKKAHQLGATRAFSSCSSKSKLVQFFMNAGFQVSAEVPNLEKNSNAICFYKDIVSNEIPTKNEIEILVQDGNDISGDTSDKAMLNGLMKEVAKLPNLFGIFLYDDQRIRDGVWGSILTSGEETFKGTPHSHINIVWVDKSLNGKGLGTILMQEAEDFAIKKGAKYLQLGTNGFQAPGFYKKLGFSLREIRPNDFVIDGKPSSLYVCTKKLYENPLQDQDLKPYFNTLIGHHYFLRPLFPEDYTAFLPVFMDEDQMKYLGDGKTRTPEETKKYAKNGARENDKTKPKYFSWVIITHQGIAGRIFISHTTEENLEKELGYFVCPAFAGRNLATDASHLAMRSMDGPFMATVHPENIGSLIVLTKLGFQADPTRMGVPKYGTIRDYYILPDKAS